MATFLSRMLGNGRSQAHIQATCPSFLTSWALGPHVMGLACARSAFTESCDQPYELVHTGQERSQPVGLLISSGQAVAGTGQPLAVGALHSPALCRGFAASAEGVQRRKGRPWPRPAEPGDDGTSAQTQSPPDASLLRSPPTSRGAPTPSLDSCPDAAALAAHIHQHGAQYSLRHVAAGMDVLAHLLANVPAGSGDARPSSFTTAPYTADPAADDDTDTADPAADDDTDTADPAADDDTDTRPPTGPFGAGVYASSSMAATQPRAESSRPPDSVQTAAPTAQCTRQLAMLGHYLMRREVNVAALAACIKGLANLDDEAQKAALGLPFVERLRDASYYYALPRQDTIALVAVLHALGKFNPWKYFDAAQRKTLGQLIRRLVSCLTDRVADLSAADAVVVLKAMVRLRLQVFHHELYASLVQALTKRVRTSLLDDSLVNPEQAVQLLWAYSRLLPEAHSTGAVEAAAKGLAGARTTAAAEARSATATTSKAGAARESRKTEAGLEGAVREQVGPAVGALSRVACRALAAHQAMDLVKLLVALAKLGPRREGEGVLQQAVGPLLHKLPSLDNAALADVVHAYYTFGLREIGLLGAIADQVVASGEPLHIRDLLRMMPCYGVGGLIQHRALWAVMLRDLRDRYAHMSRPWELLSTLDLKDAGDAQVASLLEARLREAEQEAADKAATDGLSADA